MDAKENFYIAIAGNIGSGKTTLARVLSEKLAIKRYEEPVQENPFLEPYYKYMDLYSKNPKDEALLREAQKWGYALQEFFLLHRVIDHKKIMMFKESVIQDRSIYEDKAIFTDNSYSLNLISQADYDKYQILYFNLVKDLKAPDMLVYLKTSVPVLKERIAKRIAEDPTRENERELTYDDNNYLEMLNARYDSWIKEYDRGPKIIIETDEKNFEAKTEDLEGLLRKLKEANGTAKKILKLKDV